MSYVIVCVVSVLVGLALGLAAEWPALREWRRLALRQSEVLHGPVIRTGFQPHDGDSVERARIGGRR